MVRTVYVDVLVMINFIVNYLVLIAAARLSGAYIKRWRTALSAFFGALYCAAAYFMEAGFLWAMAAKLAMGAVMVLAAFGKRGFLRVFLSFCGVSFAFGGCVMALGYISGGRVDVRNGIYYLRVRFGTLALATALSYMLMNAVFGRVSAKSAGRGICAVEVRCGERRVSFRALCDSGNHLTDPITNRPIIVAEYAVLRQVLDGGVTQVLDGVSARELPLVLDRLPRGLKFRLVPYKTVGHGLDMLVAFSPDEVRVEGQCVPGGTVAITADRISDGGAYSAICAAEIQGGRKTCTTQ